MSIAQVSIASNLKAPTGQGFHKVVDLDEISKLRAVLG